MSEDDEPKSAYELAMERLQKKDADAGVEIMPLTEQQRAAIAEVRNFYEAKAAEVEVLHQSALRRAVEPDARALLEERYRRDRERLNSERDSKIERIRRGEG
jgi:LPS O-antigen subunit length determinant protein (WzzB/FepE family)